MGAEAVQYPYAILAPYSVVPVGLSDRWEFGKESDLTLGPTDRKTQEALVTPQRSDPSTAQRLY